MSDVLIREIEGRDLQNGFLESLDSLRRASDLEPSEAQKILSEISSNPNHKIFVAEAAGKIVGSTTLLIERKFIHGGGRAGHIEDVVVASGMQGNKIGEKLVKFSLDYAQSQGCYKTTLDCADEVLGFYERLGFSRTSSGMRFDHQR